MLDLLGTPIACDVPNVSSNELLGLPLDLEIEFSIDLLAVRLIFLRQLIKWLQLS